MIMCNKNHMRRSSCQLPVNNGQIEKTAENLLVQHHVPLNSVAFCNRVFDSISILIYFLKFTRIAVSIE